MLATTDLWAQYRRLPAPIQLRILLLAGRQAAAAFRIACGKAETWAGEVRVAERAVLYEPFGYWDWQERDASLRAAEKREGGEVGEVRVEDHLRKRRVLWERERACRINGVEYGGLSSQERWEGFKRVVQKGGRGADVRRIAVAGWMGAGDLEWIAQNLSCLEALDLSNLPEGAELPSGSGAPWPAHLGRLQELSQKSRGMEIDDLELFTYFESVESGAIEAFPEESDRLRAFLEHQDNPDFAVFSPLGVTETFEQFFWRLLEAQTAHETRTGEQRSQELRDVEASIAESRLCARLKWLGVRDWRVKPVSRHVCQFANSCRSLTTFSIRGDYDRDYESGEIASIHDHVCKFVGGVINTIPDTVRTIELRLSLPFLKYFIEKLQQHKPTVVRIGIDLGAWVQIYPLRNRARTLRDADIRDKAYSAARKKLLVAYDEVCEKSTYNTAWQLPEGDGTENEEYGKGQIYKSKLHNPYRTLGGTEVEKEIVRIAENNAPTTENDSARRDIAPVEEYDFFSNHAVQGPEPQCPFDEQTHQRIANDLDAMRVDTLSKMLKRLYFARSYPGDAPRGRGREKGKKAGQQRPGKFREGVVLFALEPEVQERSTDPIHPLSLIQPASKTNFRSGAGIDSFLNAVDTPMIYGWLERTFRWRPVFDWDWFMVPKRMAKTADPDLVTIKSEDEWKPSVSAASPENNVLSRVLRTLTTQFKYLRDGGIPVHLLIGRRDPDGSSCYWGWPYTEAGWEKWKNAPFSANLEMVAPHVDTLSILYDLRNPLDHDCQCELEGLDDRHTERRAMCPLRSCPCPEGTCYFARFTSGPHPRPQVNKFFPPLAKAGYQKMANKRKLRPSHETPKGHGGLASARGAFPSGENANDHPSEDSDGEESAATRPSKQRLAVRAAFIREALGWQRFWNKYALHFTSLTTLHIRMPRAFDKVGSWRLAKLLSPKEGWSMLIYTDERQHVQTREDRMPTISPDSNYLLEHKAEARIHLAGRFVRRAWVWDRLLRVSEDGFRRVVAPQTEKKDDGRNLPTRYLVSHFQDRVNWAKRAFIDEDWETTKEGEEAEFARAVQRVSDAAARDPLLAQPLERQKRGSNASRETDFFSLSKYGQHIRNVAGDQWRFAMDSFVAELSSATEQKGGKDGDINVLEQVSERLRKLGSQRPPYEEIFRYAEEDVHPTSGLQWRDGVTLKSGTVDQVVEEESRRRASSGVAVLPEIKKMAQPIISVDSEDDSASVVSSGARDSVSEAVAEMGSAINEEQEQAHIPSILIENIIEDLPDAAAVEEQPEANNDEKRPIQPYIPGLGMLDSLGEKPKPKRALPFDESSSDEGGARLPKEPRMEERQEFQSLFPDEGTNQQPSKAEFLVVEEYPEILVVEETVVQKVHPDPSGVLAETTPSQNVDRSHEIPLSVQEVHETTSGAVPESIPIPEPTLRDDTPIAPDPTITPAEDTTPETSKTAPSRKRKTPTPAPSDTDAIDSTTTAAATPQKRARTTRSAAKKSPAYIETSEDEYVQAEEDADDDEGAALRKKCGTKRSNSGAAFKPPKHDDEGDDDSSDGEVSSRRRGRTRTSKSRTPDMRSGEKRKAKSRTPVGSAAGDRDAGGVGQGKGEGVDYAALTVVRLKEMLKERGIKLTGMTRKAQFVERLRELDRDGGGVEGV